MKHFFLDTLILTFALAFIVCLGALIEGTLPALALVACMAALVASIVACNRVSVRIAKQEHAAKRARMLQAKRQRAARVSAATAAQPKRTRQGGLSVA